MFNDRRCIVTNKFIIETKVSIGSKLVVVVGAMKKAQATSDLISAKLGHISVA